MEDNLIRFYGPDFPQYTYSEITGICCDVLLSLQFLQLYRIIASLRRCPIRNCPRIMNIRTFKQYVNIPLAFRCSYHRNHESIIKNTLLQNSKLSLSQFIQICYFWSLSFSNNAILNVLSIHKRQAIKWCQKLREICSFKIIQLNIQLGGPGRKVQIDECCLNRAKYHRGSALKKKQNWIIGIYDPDAKQGYVQLIANRSANSIIPIIQQVVLPGTEIWTDEWKSYKALRKLPLPQPYIHKTVNHSKHFTDPFSGVTTNHIEAYWSRIRLFLRKMHFRQKSKIPQYLNEWLWRQLYAPTPRHGFLNLLSHISEFNDPF